MRKPTDIALIGNRGAKFAKFTCLVNGQKFIRNLGPMLGMKHHKGRVAPGVSLALGEAKQQPREGGEGQDGALEHDDGFFIFSEVKSLFNRSQNGRIKVDVNRRHICFEQAFLEHRQFCVTLAAGGEFGFVEYIWQAHRFGARDLGSCEPDLKSQQTVPHGGYVSAILVMSLLMSPEPYFVPQQVSTHCHLSGASFGFKTYSFILQIPHRTNISCGNARQLRNNLRTLLLVCLYELRRMNQVRRWLRLICGVDYAKRCFFWQTAKVALIGLVSWLRLCHYGPVIWELNDACNPHGCCFSGLCSNGACTTDD